MRKGVYILCAAVVAGTAWAQNNRFDRTPDYENRDVISRDRQDSPRQSEVISRDRQDSRRQSELESESRNDVTFTGEGGQTYSLLGLASELRNLRSAVEQTLPALRAFNQSQGAAVAEDETTSVSGAISEVLGALGGRETNGGSSTNLTTVLEGLLSTNAPGVLKPDERTARQLATIERNLAEVEQALQSLNVAASPAPWQDPSGRDQEPLTPTGRDERRPDLNSDY